MDPAPGSPDPMSFIELPFDREQLEMLCHRYGIVRVEVFGSFARGDARADSDIDVLVTFAPGNDPGLEFFGIPDQLARIFGRTVDLLTRSSLERDPNPVFRSQVLGEARVLFDAAA